MTTLTTDKLLELRQRIAELQNEILNSDDEGKVGRLRGILRATRDELRRLRQRTRAA